MLYTTHIAEVAELVDAHDSKSCTFGCVGSSPTFGTMSAANTTVILIVGPTAVGKSALGITIAKRYSGEIVSADSRQVYRGLDSGSGKVSHKEMDGVPHHMLDVAAAGEHYSVHEFETQAVPILNRIFQQNKQPIIVGGTGFYVNALVFKNTYAPIKQNPIFRRRVMNMTSDALYKMLLTKDVSRAHTIGKTNKTRLIRALEIYETEGHIPQRTPIPRYPYIGIGLQLPRETLNAHIAERVESRWEGIKHEGEQLIKDGVSPQWLEGLGLEYTAIASLFSGCDEEQTKKILIQDIQKYAKRQMTWFTKMHGIAWFSPTNRDEIYTHLEKSLI